MEANKGMRFRAIVIGVSTGGVTALKSILGNLPADFPVPVIVVTHITPTSDDGLARLLDSISQIRVKEADEQEKIVAGTAYLAPANYHLLVEHDCRLALSIDPHVNFARPSIDVLFESAAAVYGNSLIGVVLTGAGSDGSKGLLRIMEHGGTTVIQEPEDSEMDAMPRNALAVVRPDYMTTIRTLPTLLTKLVATPLRTSRFTGKKS